MDQQVLARVPIDAINAWVKPARMQVADRQTRASPAEKVTISTCLHFQA
jgi:hypothetical protein